MLFIFKTFNTHHLSLGEQALLPQLRVYSSRVIVKKSQEPSVQSIGVIVVVIYRSGFEAKKLMLVYAHFIFESFHCHYLRYFCLFIVPVVWLWIESFLYQLWLQDFQNFQQFKVCLQWPIQIIEPLNLYPILSPILSPILFDCFDWNLKLISWSTPAISWQCCVTFLRNLLSDYLFSSSVILLNFEMLLFTLPTIITIFFIIW